MGPIYSGSTRFHSDETAASLFLQKMTPVFGEVFLSIWVVHALKNLCSKNVRPKQSFEREFEVLIWHKAVVLPSELAGPGYTDTLEK